MDSYSVLGANGQVYGPVNEECLKTWARQGRVKQSTLIRCRKTGRMSPARNIPFLTGTWVTKPMSSDLVWDAPLAGTGVWPEPYTPETAAPAPDAGAFATMHSLRRFPALPAGLLHIVTLGLFTTIYFNVMHGNLPKTRHNDPGAFKALARLLIPFYNVYWFFFTHIRLCDRIAEMRLRLGLEEKNHRLQAIGMCISLFIPYAGWLLYLILGAVFFGSLQASVNEVVRASTPRWANYRPDI